MIVNLIIRTIDRKTYNLSIDDSLTIYDIKCKLMEKYGIDISTQKLLLKGRMINNDSVISSLDIGTEETFILFIFSRKNRKSNNIDTQNLNNEDTFTGNNNDFNNEVQNNNDEVQNNELCSNVEHNDDEVQNNELCSNVENNELCSNVENNNDEVQNNELCSNVENNNVDGEPDISDKDIEDESEEDNETLQCNSLTNETTYFSEDEILENNDDSYYLEELDDADSYLETVHNNSPAEEDTNSTNITNLITNSTNINTIYGVIDSLNNNTINNHESILSNIQNTIIENIHRDPQFINNLSSNDLSEIINNYINENDINLDTPENALDTLVEIINNNPLITRYIGSNHFDNLCSNNENNSNNTSYVIDDELIKYGEIFLEIIKKSPDILGIWVKSQETSGLFDICISKIEVFDTKLADYIFNNNDTFFQYIYEKMNDIELGTTKRTDIFKPKNTEIRQELQTIFQNVINTQLNNNDERNNNNSDENTFSASVQIEHLEITQEHSHLIDKILEIFPHLSRTSIYIALQVNDYNEEMAINYLFDFHE